MVSGPTGNESILVLKDSDSADALQRWLAETESAPPQRPIPVGAGWWMLKADLSPDLDEDLLDLLRRAPAALLAQGGPAEVGRVIVFERGRYPVDLAWGELASVMPQGTPLVEQSEELIDWSARNAPKPLTKRRAALFWRRLEGASGTEFVEALIGLLGWKLPRPHQAPDLGEFQGFIEGDGHFPIVGEEHVNWEQVRWVLGFGEGFYGLWDRERPDRPIGRWPRTFEGRQQARAEQRRLFDDVIIQQTKLPGERSWIRLPDRWPGSALLVHLAPARYASLFLTSDPPRTWAVTKPGRAVISSGMAGRVGLEIPSPRTSMVEYPLNNMTELQRIAPAFVFGETVGDWHAVPDSVPRGLLETVSWVREHLDETD
jgi:hypothetical protein